MTIPQRIGAFVLVTVVIFCYSYLALEKKNTKAWMEEHSTSGLIFSSILSASLIMLIP